MRGAGGGGAVDAVDGSGAPTPVVGLACGARALGFLSAASTERSDRRLLRFLRLSVGLRKKVGKPLVAEDAGRDRKALVRREDDAARKVLARERHREPAVGEAAPPRGRRRRRGRRAWGTGGGRKGDGRRRCRRAGARGGAGRRGFARGAAASLTVSLGRSLLLRDRFCASVFALGTPTTSQRRLHAVDTCRAQRRTVSRERGEGRLCCGRSVVAPAGTTRAARGRRRSDRARGALG